MEQEWCGNDRSEIGIPLEFQGKVSSLSKNISQSGLLCRTSRQIEEMTMLDIRFQLPTIGSFNGSKFWIECSGVVVRCEKKEQGSPDMPYEVAIFFDRISDKDRTILARYFLKVESKTEVAGVQQPV